MLSALLLAATLALTPPDSASFRVYTGDGTPATLDALVEAMEAAQVVFLGEIHGDTVGHRLQAELFRRLHARHGDRLALSLEMFETDVQLVLDEYLAGLISEEQFLRASRPWKDYTRDYRPVVEYAKQHGLPVIAANAPRRYVNRVSRLGPDALGALSAGAKALLPPLPVPAPTAAYQAKWDALMQGMAHATDTSAAPHAAPAGPSNMLLAQALWDATMAWRIAAHLEAQPDARIVHLVGGFHVEGGTGTPEALQHYRPGTRFRVVIVKPVEDVDTFPASLSGQGDFVILTDAGKLPPR